MFRLVFLLSAVLFLTMLIGGRDNGQLRFGLMPQADAPAVQPVLAPETETVAQQPKPKPAPVVEAAFVPAKPVMAPQPEPAVLTEAAAPVAEEVTGRILYVTAASANVRDGPGKDHAVVERLRRGEAVLVVAEGEGPDGWSLIRIEGDGVEGYIAARLLSE